MKSSNFKLQGFKRMTGKGGMCKILLPLLILAMFAVGCSKQSVAPTVEQQSAPIRLPVLKSAAPDFTIVVLPDPQYYTSSQNGGLPAMFTAQTNWILNNQAAENIAYVACLGDISDHGDTYASEWTNARTATDVLHNNNIPYGMAVGNHDQSPNTGYPLSDATVKYNTNYGTSRMGAKSWYGGHYGSNSDSHYDLFTAGGIDWIVIYIEYDSHGEDGDNMNTWAYNLLNTYKSRKAIIVSHMIIDGSAAWGTTGSTYEQGHILYDRIKSMDNVEIMLCGHFNGEAYREETYGNHTTRMYLSDYQAGTNGGNGWMRLMKVSVSNNTVSVKTYSPYLDQYQTDSNSQFTKPLFTCPVDLPVDPVAPFANGRYKITARHSGKCLVVGGASLEGGARLTQWDYSPTTPNDEWDLTQIGTSGYYRFTNGYSGLDMNNGASYLDVAPIIQWPYTSASPNNDEWYIVDVGEGYYKIVNRFSGQVLNVEYASQLNGAYIIQFPYVGTAHNDQWQFTLIQ